MIRRDLDGLTVKAESYLGDVLRSLELASAGIVLLLDDADRLVGILTDGDARRAVLAEASLDAPAIRYANQSPYVAHITDSREQVRQELSARRLLEAPVLDADGRPLHVWLRRSNDRDLASEASVVIMAGGDVLAPGPGESEEPIGLLTIQGRPILALMIEHLRLAGFSQFFIAIGHLGHRIEDYFGDGSHLGLSIQYLREHGQGGTAGALSQLAVEPVDDVLVVNADLVTDLDFAEVLRVHKASRAAATMCVREHRTSLPFGVVDADGARFMGVTEKPTLTHLINAGVYCLTRSALGFVPSQSRLDMPQLFERLVNADKYCAVQTVTEARWIDVSSLDALDRARAMFREGL